MSLQADEIKRPSLLRRFNLPVGSFGRSVALVAGGAAAGQVVLLAVSPVLTRLYSPDDFGLLAVYASIVSIVALVAALRYELAVPLAETDASAANVVALCGVILFGMSGLLLGLVTFAGAFVSEALRAPSFRPYLWLVPLGVVGLSAYQVLAQWALRKKDFGRVARTRLTQSSVQGLVQLVAGFAGFGPGGLIGGDLIGRSSGSGTLALGALARDASAFRAVSWAGVIQVARRYVRFPLISSGSALMNSLALYAPALLMTAAYGPAAAGWFALAQRVISAPMSLLGRSVASVYLAQASEFARTDRTRLNAFTLAVCKKLFLIGVGPVVLLGVIAPKLFTLAFGSEWVTAGVFARWLAAAYLIHFVAVPVSQTLNILERQDLQLVWDVARLALVIGAFTAATMAGSSSVGAVATYSIAMLCCYAALLVLVLWAARTATADSRLPVE